MRLTSPGLLLILAVAAAGGIFLLDLLYLNPHSQRQQWASFRSRAEQAKNAAHEAVSGRQARLVSFARTWSIYPQFSSRSELSSPSSLDGFVIGAMDSAGVDYALVANERGLPLRVWRRDANDRIVAHEPAGGEVATPSGDDPATGEPYRGLAEIDGKTHVVAGAALHGRDGPLGSLLVAQRIDDRFLSRLGGVLGGELDFEPGPALAVPPGATDAGAYQVWTPEADVLAVAWEARGAGPRRLGWFRVDLPVGYITRQASASRRTVLIVLSLSIGLALLVIVGAHMLVTGPVIRLLRRLQKLEVGEAQVGDLVRDMHGEPLLLARRLEEAFDRLAYLSKTDQLTGLANRRHFEEVLDAFYYQARRYNRPLSLLVMDVDYFKAINDSVGHQGGDELLRVAAREIENACRKADLPARLGGDEFAVLLPETTSAAAAQVGERIRQAIAGQPMSVRGVEVNTTSSIGIADVNSGEMDGAEGLMALADRALYAAKELGRNRVIQAHDLSGLAVRSAGKSAEVDSLHKKLAGLDEQFKGLFLNAMEEVIGILGHRDPNMADHARNVMRYATLIAEEMELPERVVKRLQVAAMMHDIGMLAQGDDVLLAEGKLDHETIERMREHTLIAVRIMENMEFLEQEIPAVRYHHERWDGSGYPEGIAGSQIPLTARIIAVADTFDAITSQRTYRGARDWQSGVDELRQSAGTQFDPVVVDALVAVADRLGERVLRVSSALEIEDDASPPDQPGPTGAQPHVTGGSAEG